MSKRCQRTFLVESIVGLDPRLRGDDGRGAAMTAEVMSSVMPGAL